MHMSGWVVEKIYEFLQKCNFQRIGHSGTLKSYPILKDYPGIQNGYPGILNVYPSILNFYPGILNNIPWYVEWLPWYIELFTPGIRNIYPGILNAAPFVEVPAAIFPSTSIPTIPIRKDVTNDMYTKIRYYYAFHLTTGFIKFATIKANNTYYLTLPITYLFL